MLNILFNIVNKPKYYLLPTYNLASINEINQHHLEGIKYIIFDKDDTLTFLKSNQVRPELYKKYRELSDNYKCIVVSNGKNNPDTLESL
jgi:predicted HAD superfamily phosphohydrolase YqeG